MPIPPGARVIDLSRATVLLMIDVHTHPSSRAPESRPRRSPIDLAITAHVTPNGH